VKGTMRRGKAEQRETNLAEHDQRKKGQGFALGKGEGKVVVSGQGKKKEKPALYWGKISTSYHGREGATGEREGRSHNSSSLKGDSHGLMKEDLIYTGGGRR